MQILTSRGENLVELHWLLVIHLVHLLGNVVFKYLIGYQPCWVIMTSTGVIFRRRHNYAIINWSKVTNYLIFGLLILTLCSVSVSHYIFHTLWNLMKLSRIRSFIRLSFRSCLPWLLARSFLWAFAPRDSRFASWVFWVLRIPWLTSIRLSNWTDRISWFSWVWTQIILLASLLGNIINILSSLIKSCPQSLIWTLSIVFSFNQ